MTSVETHKVTKKIGNQWQGFDLPAARPKHSPDDLVVIPLVGETPAEAAAKKQLQTEELNTLLSKSLEVESLAKLQVEHIVNLLRRYDEDKTVDPTYVRVAASRLDQVLEHQLAQIPAEKREEHKDLFYTQVARLLHSMPEILIYMKPEERVKILRKYNPNVALWKRRDLEKRYTQKFNTDTKSEAFTTFTKSWDQVKRIIQVIDDYLQSDVFFSADDKDKFREMQIEKPLPDLTQQSVAFKEQYMSVAVQTFLDAQTTAHDETTRQLNLKTIEEIISRLPIASPLMDTPIIHLPDVKTKKVAFDINTLTPSQKAALGLTPETRKTQEIEVVKVTGNIEEYFVRPYLLLEMVKAQKKATIKQMFNLIETPEGLAQVTTYIERANNETNDQKPKSTLEEIDEKIVTPSSGRGFIMNLLSQVRNIELPNLDNLDDEDDIPPLVVEDFDLDPTHATNFYWVVRELLKTIIRCQELDQDEERLEKDRLEVIKNIEELKPDDQVKLLQKLQSMNIEDRSTELPIILQETMPNLISSNAALFYTTITELLEHLTSPNLSAEPEKQTLRLKTTKNAVKMGRRAEKLFMHLFTSSPEVKVTETQVMSVVKPNEN